ncbi:lipopolysaccharide biosynthesis protein [Catenuloplanes japonicus]|uniref:lipopolysaccharide biosynthesis protein n=1 Tax=Catenuloplanes japonicus TaxID=33876 RepID=UPI0005274B31|nr:polysaccharide biosynthesis C-terminal domain-containing protein [Catenuloplanes japonicus]
MVAAGEAPAPPRRRASLTVSSGLLGLAAISNRLTILVLMALLTRGAGAATVGFYGIATLSASFTAAALSFGLATFLTREYAAGGVKPAEVARLHASRLPLLAAAVVVAWPLTGFAVPADLRLAFVLVFVASLLEQWNETAWVLVRGTARGWMEAATNGACGALLIALCGAEFWRTGALDFERAGMYLLGVAALRSLGAVLFTGLLRELPAGLRGPRTTATRIRQASPYFAADLLGLAYFRSDTFVLAFFVSTAVVGAYVSAAALVGPAVQVAAAMGVGALAFAAGRKPDGNPAADDPGLVFRFFRIAGLGASGVLYLGLPLALVILFGDGESETIGGLTLVLGLFLALRFANYGLSAVLLAGGGAGGRLLVLVFSLSANLLLNLTLDGPFGAYGAAWATVATELVVAGSMLYFIRSRSLIRPVLTGVATVAGVGAVLIGAAHVGGVTVASLGAGVLLLVLAGAQLLRERRRTTG